MNALRNQVCIFTAPAEQDAFQLQEKLLMANVDVIVLNKKSATDDSSFVAFELYVPLRQEQKAKLLIQKLHE